MAVQLNQLPLDKDERFQALLIETTLLSLQAYTDDFLAAVNLFDYINLAARTPKVTAPLVFAPKSMFFTRDQAVAWACIAGRDGAITLYNFREAMQAIRSSINHVPSLKKVIKHDLCRSAVRAFEKYFPHVEDMRHAVAHAAEFQNTPRKKASHALKGKAEEIAEGIHIRAAVGSSVVIQSSFYGTLF